MLRHYVRIAWRVLTHNKVYAAVNVAGLGLGICACLVIGTIVRYEFSFDRHQPDRDRIYRVTTDERITKDMPLMVQPNVPPDLAGAIRTGVSGMEAVAPYHLLKEAKSLGFRRPEDAVGKMLFTWNKDVPIVGVVADFHKRSFHEPVRPLLIAAMACTDLAIRLDSKGKSIGEARAILDRVQREWKQFYPHIPFEFSFLDDEIAQLYQKEATMSWLMKIATGITLFISCIGLFGLTMFTANRRTKEIGIRKVLGASVADIVLLLGSDFVWLIGLAFIIAAPVAWLFMYRWLEDYAYRISFGPGLFVVSAFSLLVVTLATVSWHSVRAALANPVESLRQE